MKKKGKSNFQVFLAEFKSLNPELFEKALNDIKKIQAYADNNNVSFDQAINACQSSIPDFNNVVSIYEDQL